MKKILFPVIALVLMSCQLFTPTTQPTGSPTQPEPAPLNTTQAATAAPAETQTLPAEPQTPAASPSEPTSQPYTGPASLQIDTSQPVPGVSLTTWQPAPYPVTADQLPVQLNQLGNSAVLGGLTNEQKQFLSQNGFVVIQSGDQQFKDIRDSVGDQQGQPYYLSTDAAYHGLHVTFDELLKALERDQFRPQMEGVTRMLLDQVNSYAQTAQGTALEPDVQLAAAYLVVGLKLFDPQINPPQNLLAPEYAQKVSAQLAQIEAAAGRGYSELIPDFEDDYGAYKPVGHYADSQELQNYFKGMTWFGRVSFKLVNPQNPGDSLSRAPLVITLALRQAEKDGTKAADAYASLQKIMTFLIGPSDDPGPVELSALMDRVYGPQVQISDFADQAKWQEFQKNVDQLPAPQINSTFINSTAELQATRDWRLMGQRFTLDGYILQNMIYDKVGTAENPRKFPSGLDVMAVLGSDSAYHALDTAGETAYQNYPKQLQMLQTAVKAQPENEWLIRFYSAWLYAFIPQVAPKGDAYPPYMRTSAWGYKELNSALGSWAELKHDTVLYTKMPEFMGGGGPPSSGPPPAYVEPDPQVFYRLAYLASTLYQSTAEITNQYPTYEASDSSSGNLTLEQLSSYLQNLADTYQQLADISARELAGQPLTDQDYQTIMGCLSPAECMPYNQAELPPVPIVSAISGAEDNVLEAGTGDLNRIYVVVPLEGKLQVAQGGVFSYYEFQQPRGSRLTDEEWRQKLQNDAPQTMAYSVNFLLPGGKPASSTAFRVNDVYLITKAGGNPPLNLRDQPSKNGTVIQKMPEGTYLTIVDGPVQADGETWWKVEVADFGADQPVTGWVAENQDWYERAYGQ